MFRHQSQGTRMDCHFRLQVEDVILQSASTEGFKKLIHHAACSLLYSFSIGKEVNFFNTRENFVM